ncbi:hypothetical protein HELRODRAFT_191242 [Helobdella robusta]|uniref:Uncharacterized protein n=1 Tax=Helobdella robusta TaxID=6412 RepID=T1FSS4_HELRO|nr:hypothetical protein HELRODRAFT_191242 [Helobdella robusta]ESO06915.1 hypothetical protein HELRODRAFT_191242 [Helobdella robusta]
MDIDNMIIKTFSDNQGIYYPIVCQREAKNFVKLMIKNGISNLTMSEEIGEPEVTFTSWKNGLNKSSVGRKVIKRINKPLEKYLWTDSELNELENELKIEIEKIKRTKAKKTRIQLKIELGRSPTSKTPIEKSALRERRLSSKNKNQNAHYYMSFDESKRTFNQLCQSQTNVKNISSRSDFDKKTESLSLRLCQRGISWSGPESENARSNAESNSEIFENFKTIKLRKVGRPDLYESSNDNNNNSDTNVNSNNDNDSNSNNKADNSNNCNDTNNQKSDKYGEGDIISETDETMENTATDVENSIANEPANDASSPNYENDDCTTPKELERQSSSDERADNPTCNEYLYVFTDSNSCNNSPIRYHRFKIGLTNCPYDELQKASEFNLDIKLVSATAVKNSGGVFEKIQSELLDCLMKGKDGWYCCSLDKVLQVTGEAITWSSSSTS